VTLSTAGGPAPYNTTYSYDNIGRISNGPAGTGYTYAALQPHAVTGVNTPAGTETYTYDPAGNRTTGPTPTAPTKATCGTPNTASPPGFCIRFSSPWKDPLMPARKDYTPELRTRRVASAGVGGFAAIVRVHRRPPERVLELLAGCRP
jgi:YD repeat-containing protein